MAYGGSGKVGQGITTWSLGYHNKLGTEQMAFGWVCIALRLTTSIIGMVCGTGMVGYTARLDIHVFSITTLVRVLLVCPNVPLFSSVFGRPWMHNVPSVNRVLLVYYVYSPICPDALLGVLDMLLLAIMLAFSSRGCHPYPVQLQRVPPSSREHDHPYKQSWICFWKHQQACPGNMSLPSCQGHRRAPAEETPPKDHP